LWSDATGEWFLGAGASLNISYSDVQSGFSGTGNINANPLFVNPGAGNWKLGLGSPAVDSGNNAAVPVGITTDLAGLPRFFDDGDARDQSDRGRGFGQLRRRRHGLILADRDLFRGESHHPGHSVASRGWQQQPDLRGSDSAADGLDGVRGNLQLDGS